MAKSKYIVPSIKLKETSSENKRFRRGLAYLIFSEILVFFFHFNTVSKPFYEYNRWFLNSTFLFLAVIFILKPYAKRNEVAYTFKEGVSRINLLRVWRLFWFFGMAVAYKYRYVVLDSWLWIGVCVLFVISFPIYTWYRPGTHKKSQPNITKESLQSPKLDA